MNTLKLAYEKKQGLEERKDILSYIQQEKATKELESLIEDAVIRVNDENESTSIKVFFSNRLVQILSKDIMVEKFCQKFCPAGYKVMFVPHNEYPLSYHAFSVGYIEISW